MKKKTRILIYPLIIMGALFILTFSCKKDDNNDDNTLKDIDGNVYTTVTIGTQTWMVENLKTTKYRNGDPIPNITDGTEWGNLSTGAYCDYENTPGNSTTYGRLYNWYAVNDNRNIAPAGWHVPTDAEWTVLTDYLGGEDAACEKLKESGTTHWESPNQGATNESGFTALPAGARDYLSGSSFDNQGSHSHFWSATQASSGQAWYRSLYSIFDELYRNNNNQSLGFSVRCIKDN